MNSLIKKLDAYLIVEWRAAYRLFSVQFGVMVGVAGPVWLTLTDDQRASVLALMHIRPAWAVPIVCGVAIALRLVNQTAAPAAGQVEPGERS